MHQSMTGFASATGQLGPHAWTWDVRSVNAKGLDIKCRLPDWLPGLEQAIKAQVSQKVTRGNVTVNLRVQRTEASGGLALNAAAMEQVLLSLAQIEDRAMDHGITLAPSKASDLLSLRGVLETEVIEDDTDALANHLTHDFAAVVDSFVEMRQTEGRALADILTAQFDQIDALVTQAESQLDGRSEAVKDAMHQQLSRVMDADLNVDPQRIAQELALIAVKGDITEELDRLRAHIKAARALIATNAPAGRKLDFLAQEFNREANTLCSKSQNVDLTSTGLELKAVIEQMREQVQNLE